MSSTEKKLIELLEEYITCSSYFMSVIKDNYPIDKEGILRSRRLNLIPKDGTIGDIYFNFHGGGCYFETSNDSIDVDFGPNDRTDGFDFDRINNFYTNRKVKYHEIQNETELKEAFESLFNQSIIFKPSIYPNPHLYYLKKYNPAGPDL